MTISPQMQEYSVRNIQEALIKELNELKQNEERVRGFKNHLKRLNQRKYIIRHVLALPYFAPDNIRKNVAWLVRNVREDLHELYVSEMRLTTSSDHMKNILAGAQKSLKEYEELKRNALSLSNDVFSIDKMEYNLRKVEKNAADSIERLNSELQIVKTQINARSMLSEYIQEWLQAS